jgi:hypothetical protein
MRSVSGKYVITSERLQFNQDGATKIDVILGEKDGVVMFYKLTESCEVAKFVFKIDAIKFLRETDPDSNLVFFEDKNLILSVSNDGIAQKTYMKIEEL